MGFGGPQEVLMTKHRTITGLVAVAVLAVAAIAVTMRSHSPWTDSAANFDERWSTISSLPTMKDTN